MKAEMYTKTVCPHCVRAKGMLKMRGIEWEEIDAVANMDTMIARVVESGNIAPRTVPQIFLDGEYIGGADDLRDYLAKKDAADDIGGFEI